MHFARGRAEKVWHVNMNMQKHSSRASNQGQVWEAIAMKESVMACHSETSAMSELYKNFSAKLDDFVNGFTPLPNQVGAVFALGGDIVGMDIFDSPVTFAKLIPKFVRSYGLDAIEDQVAQRLNDEQSEEIIPGLLVESEIAQAKPRRKRPNRGGPTQKSLPPGKAEVMNWLEGLLKTKESEFKAVGLGEDIRLDGKGYFGAALLAEKKAVHFCAFTAH
jgi:hypothetical protein